MNQLLHAVHFAAEKHSEQRRKNCAATPYINHPIEVAEHLNRVGNVTNEDVLIAAILHDTVEDTNTTPEEISQVFGESVSRLVMECTDDKSLEKADRKRLQVETASKKSRGAKQIKIADKTCNLRSILDDPPRGWSNSRQLEYFEWASQVYAGLKGVNSLLDSEIESVLADGIETLSAREV